MKKPFRHFRGEFSSSDYLYKLLISPNFAVQDVIDELVYQTLFQWKLEDEISKGEMAIRDDDIVNIGIVAGVFQSLGQFFTNIGSIYFTRSHTVNGVQRSERGLFDMKTEVFKYMRVEQDKYDTDIAVEASPARRITVVPTGTPPVGYVRADTPLFDIAGEILWDNLLSEPPEDVAYIPFFGEQFLFFEETFLQETTLTIPVLKLLIECMQWIRYNGPTTAAFLQVAQILGEGHMCDFKIIQQKKEDSVVYYEVQYRLDHSVDIENQLRRYAAWLIVCRLKFKQFMLNDLTKA